MRLDRSLSLLSCIVAAVLALAPACGRKTPVRPPELAAPNPVETLTATNVARGIELEWDRPTRYVDGTLMLDLAGFRLERGRPCCGFAVHQVILVEDRQRFRRAKRFRHVDQSVEPGETYSYRVVAFTLDAYDSVASDTIQIVREVPPPPP